MKSRCTNPNDQSAHRYIARGITLCPEWYEFLPFYDWANSHGYKRGLMLDRIDNDGNYEPGNCAWVPSYISGRNREPVKLTPADVVVIRDLRKSGTPYKVLAGLYGISQSCVWSVLSGKNWKSVA